MGTISVPTIDGGEVYAPSVGGLATITVPLIGGGVTFGPRITQTLPAEEDYVPRISASLFDVDGVTWIRDLPNSWGREWQEVLNEAGTGRLTMAVADEDAGYLWTDRIVRLALDGVTCFAFVIETYSRVVVAKGEEVDETVTVSGRGVLSRLADAIVYPVNGAGAAPVSDWRLFSFADPAYDASGWGDPISLGAQPAPSVPEWRGYPVAWPDASARWLWVPQPNPSVASLGRCYFRAVTPSLAAGRYVIHATGDNLYSVFVDGVPLLGDAANPWCWRETRRAALDLSAGVHVIAAMVENTWAAGTNPGGFLCSLAAENSDGSLGGVQLRTNLVSGWKCAAYPAQPPGFTVGRVLRLLVDEAQARGTIPDVTLGFDDFVDANGNPWPFVPECPVAIGKSLLEVVTSLASQGLCDVAMTAALRLDAWRYGEHGSASGVNLTNRLTEMTYEQGVA